LNLEKRYRYDNIVCTCDVIKNKHSVLI